jgi:predicted ATPase
MPSGSGRVKRVVLTGGPGAGKSIITQQLVSQRPDRFVLVPEAATQVYAMLNTRWDRLDLEGRRDVQRRIYRFQREQEDRYLDSHPNVIHVLDRGTIDGAAYWPDGAASYWQDLRTTHDAELARYNTVIWLESAAALGLYDGDSSNFCRFEDAAGAVASGKLLLDLWGGHPQLRHVGAFTNLADKVSAVRELLHTE